MGETLLDVCIPVLGDSERLRISLERMHDAGMMEEAHFCISENYSDSRALSTLQELGILSGGFSVARTMTRITFAENLASSGSLGRSPFLTFCGAGDVVGHRVFEIVDFLDSHPDIDVVTGVFDLQLDPRFLHDADSASTQKRSVDSADHQFLLVEDKVGWLLNGSLSSIGSWVMRRSYFERAVAETAGLWEHSRFPMRIWTIPYLLNGEVFHYSGTVFISQLELASDRQTNAIYGGVDWCTELSAAAQRISPSLVGEICRAEKSQIRGNILSFLAFGSKNAAQHAVEMLEEETERMKWRVVVSLLGWNPLRTLLRSLIRLQRLVKSVQQVPSSQ